MTELDGRGSGQLRADECCSHCGRGCISCFSGCKAEAVNGSDFIIKRKGNIPGLHRDLVEAIGSGHSELDCLAIRNSDRTAVEGKCIRYNHMDYHRTDLSAVI